MTTTISLTDFRAHTDEIINTVIEGQETVIVTLTDGRKFVLVPDAEWQNIDETAYLSSTAANRVALKKSLQEVVGSKTVELDL